MAKPPKGSTEAFPRPYGKYELLGRLGDGGMAEVFLARKSGVAGFRKTVVIKRILPHLARKKRFVEMFVAEASLAAEVRHRNVVQVYELGRLEDELFMVMEYIEGIDLRMLLGKAAKLRLRIPPWFSVHVACEVLEALAFAWTLEDEQGQPRHIVHRDVTPSNIFISSLGDVKLGDFGVARDHSRESQTRVGQLKGKLAYMAPEQLYSKPPDHQVDVFACGVVLWECLAQRRLFGGRPEIEIMQAIAQGPRRNPSDFLADIPSALDAIVLSALEIDKATRLSSAQDFQSHLLEVLSDLKPRVRAGDVRGVVAEILGQERGHLDALDNARQRSQSSPSSTFTPSGSGSMSYSPPDGVLAGTQAGAELKKLDEIQQRLKRPDSSSSLSQGPRSDLGSLRVFKGTPSTADGPESSFPGAAETRAGSVVRANSGTGAHPPVSRPGSVPRGLSQSVGTPEHAREGLMSPASPSRLGESPPLSAEQEIDMEALVHEAVKAIEASAPQDELLPSTSLLAGIEHRRLMEAGRQDRPERWAFVLDSAKYSGPHPFWIRDHDGAEFGPCSLAEALQVIKVEVKSGFGDRAFVGAAQPASMPMSRFLELGGMEAISDDEDLPRMANGPSWSGSHVDHSLGSVFTTLTRSRANGRLVIEAGGTDRFRVIELCDGQPTFVVARGEHFQLPQLLVTKRVLSEGNLAPILHGVMAKDQPLGQVLEETAGVNLRRYFPALMKERLVGLFTHGFTRFFFDAEHSPRFTEPFAPNLLSVLGELTLRHTPMDTINHKLEPVLSSVVQPVSDFERLFPLLSLKPEQTRIAERLLKSRRISRVLDSSTSPQKRMAKAVCYLLLDTELMRSVG